MIASNLIERIHPIYAQSKPKVPYLSVDVLIEHSIDSPLVMPSATAWLTLHMQTAYASEDL